MPRVDVRKALVLGSGPIKIAEAAEFDYSGSQALKALREEGIETVLVNPNVATIQTSHRLADRVYLAPLKPEFVAEIIERERPDAILLGFGGQTALSLGVALKKSGVLDRYGVRVLGTPIEGVERALSRDLFRRAMLEAGLPVPPSRAARSPGEALEAAGEIGYPVIVRVSFNLGGGGSFTAWSPRELGEWLERAFAQSEVGEVLVERYLHHWKEVEFEVVRDYYGNTAAIACMENVDPMGVHTGDSIVVAPCQTLTDSEYNEARRASIGVAEAIGLVGEGNVQLALNPETGEYYVIETNPRMSRSSALASKATGYPLAYIAAKLALGYRLHELLNLVTRRTTACFEPSLDYVVVKVPRWDLDKFEGAERRLGSEMKSIGEVMAIGRSYIEALQKAVRMLDIGEPGLTGGPAYRATLSLGEAMEKLRSREPYWPLWAAKAIALGATVGEVAEATGVDHYFLYPIEEVVRLSGELERRGPEPGLLEEAWRLGFSAEQVEALTGSRPRPPRPRVKQVDTLAAEWPAETNYLYTTHGGSEDDVEPLGARGVLVLGAGVFRIGVSVEFDWAVVNVVDALREMGYKAIVVNNNPETVSTDWDASDRLYFEELTLERVLDIIRFESPRGVVAFAGGQIANKLARPLAEAGARLLGTGGASVDRAEDREKFSRLLDELGLAQPPWASASSLREALRFADEVGYPVLVRPSYIISGSAVRVAWSPGELEEYITRAARVSPRHPVVVTKYYPGAPEFEVDAVGDGPRVAGTVIGHIEPAGVHSGDSTMTIPPPPTLPRGAAREAERIAAALSEALNIRGPFNLQLLHWRGRAYVIELNLRASRSMPFTSKTVGVNLAHLAVRAALEGLPHLDPGFTRLEPRGWWGVKSPQFSWARLRGSYPSLGPEMRSTGEAAALGWSLEEALLKSWLSVQGNRLPRPGEVVLAYNPDGAPSRLPRAVEALERAGLDVYTVEGMEVEGAEPLPPGRALEAIRSGRAGLLLTRGSRPERDYRLRRLAADRNVPLVLDDILAEALAAAIEWHSRGGRLHLADLREYWAAGAPTLLAQRAASSTRHTRGPGSSG
ncbi:MAG: carbamoyl-phosphate synthase (glutamine-hydrolyzing) large subunit [Desulfurococcales archaeon]|nr:carbamoyl-phosphate synthase (glutamine-hydrolyzing) large subunit [Desulfurococcales archaeon]